MVGFTVSARRPNISDWMNHLSAEFDKPYMHRLKKFLIAEKKRGKCIFPETKYWFLALKMTALSRVKVVILGQDPYPTPGHAHGLSFSVPRHILAPYSLKNIFDEIKSDLGIDMSYQGDLSAWAKQGVLLLNSVLTVNSGARGSHKDQGWEIFTDKIIDVINEQRTHIVFLLWGRYALEKKMRINAKKHLILTAAHPSPLSAMRGFFGCKHFSKANIYLKKHHLGIINWQL